MSSNQIEMQLEEASPFEFTATGILFMACTGSIPVLYHNTKIPISSKLKPKHQLNRLVNRKFSWAQFINWLITVSWLVVESIASKHRDKFLLKNRGLARVSKLFVKRKVHSIGENAVCHYFDPTYK